MKPSPLPVQKDNDSGSPTSGEPEFLVIGKLGRPHGLHGEILMVVYTDFPDRIEPGETFFVGPRYQPIKLIKRRPHTRGMLVTFEGYHVREKIAELRNQLVYVRTSDRPPLEQGEYYHHQLLGLQVIDENSKPLGLLSSILETGANDVYVVRDQTGAEILVPAIDSVVLDIDLEHKQIRVHLLAGLLPEE
jgi:16S rRNA processing protein RimM